MFDDSDELFSNTKSSQKLYISPRQTTNYIQLRFQLARFRVYRIVQLPLTFTFANLHTLIQYMFGWSDSHIHHAEVFPNVVLHDDEELLGTIKSCGRKRPLEDYELGDPRAIEDWKRFEPADKPIYRVQPKVTHRKDRSDRVMKMEEKGVMLESIWSHNEANNVSDGQCSNSQIGIIYTYDLGDEWTVHITCEQGDIFHRLDVASNLPFLKDARGAPPIEHTMQDEVFGEYDAEDKEVSSRLFDISYFERYCDGRITSVSRKTKLEILTPEEAEEQYREYLQRQKEKRDRIASGEWDEDEEYDEDEELEELDDITGRA